MVLYVEEKKCVGSNCLPTLGRPFFLNKSYRDYTSQQTTASILYNSFHRGIQVLCDISVQ